MAARQNRIQYIWQRIHRDIFVPGDDFLYIVGDYCKSMELHLWISSTTNALDSLSDHSCTICRVFVDPVRTDQFCAIQLSTMSKGKIVSMKEEISCHDPDQMIALLREWVQAEQLKKQQQKQKRPWILKRARHSTSEDLLIGPDRNEDVEKNHIMRRLRFQRSQSVDSGMFTPRKIT